MAEKEYSGNNFSLREDVTDAIKRLDPKQQISVIRAALNQAAQSIIQAGRKKLRTKHPRLARSKAYWDGKSTVQHFKKKVHRDLLEQGITVYLADYRALFVDVGTVERQTHPVSTVGNPKYRMTKAHSTGSITASHWWKEALDENKEMIQNNLLAKAQEMIIKKWNNG